MSALELSVLEIARRVRSGDLVALDVAQECLQAIKRAAPLNAFLHVSEAQVLETAARIDARRARGEPMGPLAGAPIAIKDALCTRDAPTTAGSKILTRSATGAGWRPPYDATAVERLRRADALIVGKTNLDEFAMGSSNENSAFGPVLNPWDRTRVAGGSSGGSAAAVAAGLVPGAIGSDTGGSIRQPAALCGVVGVKPTYGRVSRYGLIAFASSLDQVGPLTYDTRSAAQVLEVIAGHDPLDSTSSTAPVGKYVDACSRDVAGLRIGVPEEYFQEGLNPEVERNVREAIDLLTDRGCHIQSVSMPHTRYGVATYYILATAEAASNLARYDGVRFGLRDEPHAGGVTAMYGATRDAGFGPEVKRRILLGTYVLSAGYYEAYYKKAQKVRTLVKRDFDSVFGQVDVLIAPTSPTPAFRLGEKTDDPLSMYLADVFTLPTSLAGVCALSVPCRPTEAVGAEPSLPVGLQLMAPAFCEERLFSLAATWEQMAPKASRLGPPPQLALKGVSPN
jgi:aspartyl-tRNA(Asn)/glutamyl-tRNA(Gln) amidotransferase subunit A